MKNVTVTGRAKVKDNSTWRYKGLTLDIIGIYATYNDGQVYPVGTRELKLSLEGTKWYDEQKYTIIPETDLEVYEINIEQSIEHKLLQEAKEVYNSCSLSPSELKHQRDELLAMLEVGIKEIRDIKAEHRLLGDGERFIYQASKLIQKLSNENT